MSTFNALVIKEEEAVMPARRYRSPPRLPLDFVSSALSLAGRRESFNIANRLELASSGESGVVKVPRDPRSVSVLWASGLENHLENLPLVPTVGQILEPTDPLCGYQG
jgi:hypothetical protein